MLRLNREVSVATLNKINAEFAYLCESGVIETIQATPSELADKDNLDKFRIAFQFAREILAVCVN